MRIIKWAIALMGVFLLLMLFPETKANAGVTDNAISFYEKHGNNAVFYASSKTNGDIYCATRGNSSTSTVKYKTVGWKMSVKDNKGKSLQVMYFKLGGNYLVRCDRRSKGGYEYDLYAITLYTLKQRMNEKALKALNQGKCSITLDACMVVSKKGVDGGSISDEGKVKGSVYTTYKGISEAAEWSDAAKATLKTYFNKSVTGLFFNVVVKKTTGVKAVKGGGSYCYGSYVTVSATMDKGYEFDRWESAKTYKDKSKSFYVSKNSSWIAYAKSLQLQIVLHRNRGLDDRTVLTQSFAYPGTGEALRAVDWTKEGYWLAGWGLFPESTEPSFELLFTPGRSFIYEKAPRLDLYAVWKPNAYTIKFEGKLVRPLASIKAYYTDKVKVPENGESLGFSLSASSTEELYKKGQVLTVKELADKAGLTRVNQGVIVLYAVWDGIPRLEADDLYYTLAFAQAGRITEDELKSHCEAVDSQEGKLDFVITNYNSESFRRLKESSEVMVEFRTSNSLGVSLTKSIVVHIVDSSIKDEEESFGRVRFISDRYLLDGSGNFVNEKAGGLMKNSCWKNTDYLDVLLFSCRKL